MSSGNYRFAEIPVRITSVYPAVQKLCEEYRTEQSPRYMIETTERDILYERKRSAETDAYEGNPQRNGSDAYYETLAVYRKLADCLLAESVLLFHGSAAAIDGETYLFTAKSGTGKSTHTRLWREVYGDRVVMVNDDKPLLKITEEGVRVFGTPWNGKHRLSTNIGLPLKALCILTRDTENHIERISSTEAYPMLLQQSSRPQNAERMERTMQLLDLLVKKTVFYRLGCNMEQEAAVVSYEGMRD